MWENSNKYYKYFHLIKWWIILLINQISCINKNTKYKKNIYGISKYLYII